MPGAAPAQQPGKTPRIGVLVWWSAGTAVAERIIGPFREGLRELGYIEGQTLLIEWRFVGERGDRAGTLATELVGLGVDLIVAVPGPAMTRGGRSILSVLRPRSPRSDWPR